jgi:hypothetical protein
MNDEGAARMKAGMDAIDAMPPEERALVHEYGYKLVAALKQRGHAGQDLAETLAAVRKAQHEDRMWKATKL